MEPAQASSERQRHGGDLDAARARYPGAPEPWIDLSTGINPRPYPVPALADDAWTRLPTETDLQGLLGAASARYGAADPRHIVAAPGTQALIQILPRLVDPARVAILGPTYDEHEASWRRNGHDVVLADGLPAAFAGAARVVVVVNPNNPTGRLLSRADLNVAGQRLAREGGLLVVDEAFMDTFPPDASLIPEMPPATVVLRSFGKTYGLAGLRLGFAASSAEFAARLAALLGPWAVSGPAIAIGAQALADGDWLRASAATLTADARRIDDLLAAAGCQIVGGTPLFRLAAHADAAAIVDRLGHAGIHVRRFALTPRWLRFGLPACDAQWQRLADALAGA